jgi:hypothetical protein
VSIIRGITFKKEWLREVWMDQNWCHCESSLEWLGLFPHSIQAYSCN